MMTDSKALRTLWTEIRRTIPLSEGSEALRALLETITVGDLVNGRLMLHAPSRFARDKVLSHMRTLLLERWRQKCPFVATVEVMVGRRHALPEVPSAYMPSFPEWERPALTAPAESSADPARTVVVATHLPTAQQLHSTPDDIEEEFSMPTDSLCDASSPHAIGQKYSFDAFVVGESNRIAFNAVKHIASHAHAPFNPLFLYGTPGVGKTHLMHAALLHMMQHSPQRRVLYLSAEQFMYRFVRALRRKDTENFKDELRALDVLMVDDIQFLSGKESTQEEFFHTFNVLIDQQKHLIISADQLPHRIDDLSPRLKSRLNGGLSVEVLPPEFDLRLRFVRQRLQNLQQEHAILHTLDPAVSEFLASRISTTIRDLEGALNRIVARITLGQHALTIDNIKALLSDMLYSKGCAVSPDEVLRQVSLRTQIKYEQLVSETRMKEVVEARHLAMLLLREAAGLSYVEIGKTLGGRAHTTVLHAVRKIDNQLSEDGSLRAHVVALREHFGCIAIPHA